MRFLIRVRNVSKMFGVDATEKVVKLGRERCQAEGLSDRVKFRLADVCESELAANSVEFVWGEDAWCYVVDKPKLIAEAARLVKPGGVVAFTDWIEGPEGLTEKEAKRFLTFMKFPNVQDLQGYQKLLTKNGCKIQLTEYTGRFAPYADLYLEMLSKQLSYDALKIIGFDIQLFQTMAAEMTFMQQLAHAGKIDQAIFVARKQ